MNALRRTGFALLGAVLLACGACGKGASTGSRPASAGPALSEKDFFDPPVSARPSVLWAWLNGFVDRDQLTRELEELKAKGLGGAIIWDVGSLADPKKIIPAGPAFLGPESVASISYAIDQANRLGLELGLFTSSSWNAGGAWIKPENASRQLLCRQIEVQGPGRVRMEIPLPEGATAYWKDIAVLAVPAGGPAIDISGRMDPQGRLDWDAPAGEFEDHAHRRQQHGADPRMPEPELRRPDHRSPEPRGRDGRHDLHPRPDPERAEKPRRAEDLHARQLRGPRGGRLDGRLHRRIPGAARLRPRPLSARAVRSRGSGPRDRGALPLRLPQDRQRPDHRQPFPHGQGPAAQVRRAPPGRSGTWRVRPRGRPESAGLGRYPDGGVLEPRAVLGGQGGRQRGAHLRPAHRRRRDPDRLAELAGRAGGIQAAVRHRPVRRAEPSHVPHLHPQSAGRGPAGFRLPRRRALQRQRHLVGPGRPVDRVHVPLRLPAPAGPLRGRRGLLLRRPGAEPRARAADRSRHRAHLPGHGLPALRPAPADPDRLAGQRV